MKKLNGYEGANGSFKPTEKEAIADIIGAAGYGTAWRALDVGERCQDSFQQQADQLSAAILAAAAIIQRKKRK